MDRLDSKSGFARARLGLAVAVLLVSSAVARAQSAVSLARDWSQAPAIAEGRAPGDLFALGDVHGDYDRMVPLLKHAGVIGQVPDAPESIRWAAGDAVLVCTGDLIDKGPQSLKVIAALRALQRDASRAGGRLIVTMGNHEAEFLAHPDSEKVAEFRGELIAAGLDPDAVAMGTDSEGVGVFLRELPFAALVNDWFFAHAGNTKGRTLAELRAAIEDGVRRLGFEAPILSDDDSLIEARLHPHPWWEQAADRPMEGLQRLRSGVKALGVAHLVIGHQPGAVVFAGGTRRRKGEMFMADDGLLFLIDVGMSRGIDDSMGAILRIHERNPVRATVIDHQGGTSRLWTQR